MPNAVTYSDEKTLPKVLRALMGNDDLEFNQVMGAVDRLQAAGILFREEAEARAPRTPAEAAEDARAASSVAEKKDGQKDIRPPKPEPKKPNDPKDPYKGSTHGHQRSRFP